MGDATTADYEAGEKLDDSITLAMAEAGGRAVDACLRDAEFMRKANRAGELASRAYRAMLKANGRQASFAANRQSCE
jgi:hypothetical protein